MHTEYKVVTDYSLEQLTYSITHWMQNGWQPIGGISMIVYVNNPDEYKEEGADPILYAQALVK